MHPCKIKLAGPQIRRTWRAYDQTPTLSLCPGNGCSTCYMLGLKYFLGGERAVTLKPHTLLNIKGYIIQQKGKSAHCNPPQDSFLLCMVKLSNHLWFWPRCWFWTFVEIRRIQEHEDFPAAIYVGYGDCGCSFISAEYLTQNVRFMLWQNWGWRLLSPGCSLHRMHTWKGYISSFSVCSIALREACFICNLTSTSWWISMYGN
jgi:hypothetical protein